MLSIPCPHCGPRDETEFKYGGQAGIAYPADPDALAHRLTPRRDDPEAVATVRKAVEATLTHHLGAWRALGVV